MTDAEVRGILDSALTRLVEAEHSLLELKVGEQTLAQHLSKYIEAAVPDDLNVDVEYNKHGIERKVLLLPPKGEPGAHPVTTMVRPDIVVHARGVDAKNLLVIEVKKPGQDLTWDRAKLVALREQYGYRNAAHVIVGYYKGQVVREIHWVE